MPEKTESAWYMVNNDQVKLGDPANLCSAITWNGIVPQRFVWPRNWSLMLVISMGEGRRHQCQSCEKAEHHGEGENDARISGKVIQTLLPYVEERRKVSGEALLCRALNDAGPARAQVVPDMETLANVLSEPFRVLLPLPNIVR
jgi:hypothetical protein